MDNDNILCDLLYFIESQKKDEVIIVGDFNLNTIDWTVGSAYPVSANTTLFLNTVQEVFYSQIIKEPTRYRDGQKSNVLDLVLTNNSSFIHDVGYLNHLNCSDHVFLCIYLNFYVIIHNKKRILYYRGDYASMNAYLNSWDLIQVFKDLDLQQCCDILYDKIAFAVDQFIPYTGKPISSKSGKAWVKQELGIDIKEISHLN